MTTNTDTMTTEGCAIEAVNLAREINERQERLEVLKTTPRARCARSSTSPDSMRSSAPSRTRQPMSRAVSATRSAASRTASLAWP